MSAPTDKPDLIGYFDDACEPVNPGGTMAFGAVVFEDDKLIWQSAAVAVDPPTGPTTNNLAEYTALVQLLGYFIDNGLTDRSMEVRGDSQLVICQMFGTWKITEDKPYAHGARAAQQLLKQFIAIRGRWIPRGENEIADALTKIALELAGVPVAARRAG